MNYPVWPDSGVGYPRTLLNSGGMRSLPLPPPPASANDDGSGKCVSGGPGKYANANGNGSGNGGGAGGGGGDQRSSAPGGSSRLNDEGPRGQLPPSNYNDDESLLKVSSKQHPLNSLNFFFFYIYEEFLLTFYHNKKNIDHVLTKT